MSTQPTINVVNYDALSDVIYNLEFATIVIPPNLRTSAGQPVAEILGQAITDLKAAIGFTWDYQDDSPLKWDDDEQAECRDDVCVVDRSLLLSMRNAVTTLTMLSEFVPDLED
ncbi:hypothetical protein [Lacticaseibacillus parakribbianus]|uniref:hypothetical protein n=1 Tax=Lacticaseibacillus parakribbianus TaxID=2970927 RepID=UPI0021CB1CC6|nr:hypothetical protein [Lacticaseibacillus parakribbianus]